MHRLWVNFVILWHTYIFIPIGRFDDVSQCLSFLFVYTIEGYKSKSDFLLLTTVSFDVISE